jgi:hypothetical protein
MKARKRPTEPLANLVWTADDERTIARMLQNKRTYRQIGKALGRSKQACQERASAIRGRMRDAGMPPEQIEKIFPRARAVTPRQVLYKKKAEASEKKDEFDVPSFLPPRPRHPGKPKAAPEPEKVIESLPAIETSISTDQLLIQKRLGDLLIAAAACAIGIWFMVGLSISSMI